MNFLYFHGLRTTPGGTKPTYFKNRIPDLIVPDFGFDLSVKTLDERIAIAENLLKSDSFVIGSSLGGWLAAKVAERNPEKIRGLFLINPALRLREWPDPTCPVLVVSGAKDKIVPPDTSAAFITRNNRKMVSIAEGDHQLHAFTEEIWSYFRQFLAEFNVSLAES